MEEEEKEPLQNHVNVVSNMCQDIDGAGAGVGRVGVVDVTQWGGEGGCGMGHRGVSACKVVVVERCRQWWRW